MPTRAQLRDAGQEARAGAATPQSSPAVDEAPTVGEASDGLLDVILAAHAAGEIFDDDVAAELLDDAREVKEAHALAERSRRRVRVASSPMRLTRRSARRSTTSSWRSRTTRSRARPRAKATRKTTTTSCAPCSSR
jgi:hypothetical protein